MKDELTQKIRDIGIDILVDLAGHTRNNRLSVFAQKTCSHFINMAWLWLHHGLSAIDYFLTNEAMAPKGSEHLFSENYGN